MLDSSDRAWHGMSRERRILFLRQIRHELLARGFNGDSWVSKDYVELGNEDQFSDLPEDLRIFLGACLKETEKGFYFAPFLK